MHKHISSFVCVTLILISTAAFAQNSPTLITPGSSVTTTTTTTITTPDTNGIVSTLPDGTKIEVDPDGSVYAVYPDGARVAAPDGVHTLTDGATITVKGGKKF